jgi:hypothetical protein
MIYERVEVEAGNFGLKQSMNVALSMLVSKGRGMRGRQNIKGNVLGYTVTLQQKAA